MKTKATIKWLLAAVSLLLTLNLQAQNAPQISSKAHIPQYVSDYASKDRSDFLKKHKASAANITYRFYYDSKGDAHLEATVKPKAGYTWDETTWILKSWKGGSGIVGVNGIVYQQTQKNSDEAAYRMQMRRSDATFNAIEKVVLQVATEYDYDFYAVYKIAVKYRNPKVKKASCEGYSDATISALKKHPLVDHVEKWAGGGHAWNVIVLKDKRKIYADVTWYDGNNIDKDGYVIHKPVRSPVNLTFDLEEFNSLGGAIDTQTNKLLRIHFAYPDVHRVK